MRPNRRNVSIHVRHKAMCALDRVKVFNYKRYALCLSISSLSQPPGTLKEKLKLISLIFLISALRIVRWTPPVIRMLRKKYMRFADIEEGYCYTRFRLQLEHLEIVRSSLRIPDYFVLSNGSTVDGEEAFLIFLHRFCRPRTLLDSEEVFGIELTKVSRIFNHMVLFLDLTHKHILSDNLQFLVDTDRLRLFNECIKSKIGSINNGLMPSREEMIFAFLDGTRQQVCRIGGNYDLQLAIYDGKNKIHSLGYQGLSGPDGIIYDTFGPLPGRRHDIILLQDSDLNHRLHNVQQGNLMQYKVYADKAYNDMSHVLGAYHGLDNQPWQLEDNDTLKRVRIGVEWAFGKVVSNNKYIDYYKGMSIKLQPVAKMYRVAILFANVHTCLYGSQSSLYFNILPPTLEEYLRENV